MHIDMKILKVYWTFREISHLFLYIKETAEKGFDKGQSEQY